MPYEQRHIQDIKPPEQPWSLKRIAVIATVSAAFAFLIMGSGDWITRDKIPSTFAETDAVVVNAEIESSTIGGKNLADKPTVFYSAMITFKYTVQGNDYSSRRTVGNVSRNNHAPVQAIVTTYSPGTLIPIVYNKINPEESRIHIQAFPVYLVYVAASILSLILSVLSVLYIPDFQPKKQKFEHPHHAVKKEWADDVEPDIPPLDEKPLSQEIPEEVKGLLGSWTLLYQIPSMREIISSSLTANSAMGADIQAVMNAGAETLTVNINPSEMEFIYMDSKLKGSCDIVSRFTCSGNRLDLEHISMDFLIADVEGFPPDGYTFEIKDHKLTLKSDGVKGLGGRPIIYILSRAAEDN